MVRGRTNASAPTRALMGPGMKEIVLGRFFVGMFAVDGFIEA
jgi:hypothetical protein